MECEEWGKRVVNLIRNRSGTFMVRNFEKIILEGDSGMYFATFQTTSCLWCTFPLNGHRVGSKCSTQNWRNLEKILVEGVSGMYFTTF